MNAALRPVAATALIASSFLTPAGDSARPRLAEVVKPPPQAAEIVRGEVGARVDFYLSRLSRFGFSGTVLIAQGDEVLLLKGYGWANEVHRVPNTPETVFSIQSVTKQFTAAAILRLGMEGKLATGDSISRFLDGVPPDKQGITLHHLLSHTSGILSGTTVYLDDPSREGVLKTALETPLEFEPGTDFLYSNIGYALLAMVVEKASGLPNETYVEQELFRPAGLTSTGYRRTDWDENRLAHQYLEGEDLGTRLDRPWPDWNFMGAGEIRSTVVDLYAWHRALLGRGILSEEAKRKLYTPVQREYAYGWNVEETPHGTCIHHNGGSSDGGGTSFRRYVDAGMVAILMCNRDGERLLFADRVVEHVDGLMFGDDVPLPPEVEGTTPEALSKYTGLYRLSSGDSLRVGIESGMLTLRAYGQNAADLALGIADAEPFVAASRAAQKVLDGLAAGDPSPFRHALADTSRGRILDVLARQRADGEAEMGAFQRYAVLGTVPDWISDLGPRMTIVRVEFARGSDVFRLHWSDRGIVALGGSVLPEPALLWVQPVEGNRFAGYHIATGRSVSVTFTPNAQGKIDELAFGPDSPRARRVGE